MKGILIDTDILFDHLMTMEYHRDRKNSLLEILLIKEICFISVLNAAELFLACENEVEKKSVRELLNAMNILGVHPRYALLINQMGNDEFNSSRALFLATALSNKIKIATFRKELYPVGNENFADLKKLVTGEDS